MKTKLCKGPVCQGIEKPIEAFNRDRSRPDGYGPYCKECQAHYHQERYKTPEGREVKLSYNAQFYQTEAGKASQRKAYLQNTERYPDKRKARAAVNNAIARGKLTRASTHKCAWEGCDEWAQQYHHHSYEPEFWLDVIPYCTHHHTLADNRR